MELPSGLNESKKDKQKKIIIWIIWLICEFVLVSGVVLVADYVFHNPLCNFMFKCGCTWNWAGGWDQCNIHSTDPDVAKCPWCSAPSSVNWITQWGVVGTMIFTYYVVAYLPMIICYLKRRKQEKKDFVINEPVGKKTSPALTALNVALRIVMPMVTFFVFGIFVGFMFYITSDYPTFIIE
jgi:hypothetical protein